MNTIENHADGQTSPDSRPPHARPEEHILHAVRAGRSIQGVLVLDVHSHIGWAFNMPRRDTSAESMLPVMDRLGVDAACISSSMAISVDPPKGNDEVLTAVAAFRGRFIGAAVVNPHYPQEIEAELERMFREPGVGIIKVHPNMHAYQLDGPAYRPVWSFAEHRRIPVISHTWGEGRGFDHPSQAERVARQHPRLPFIMGHGGGSPAGVMACIEAARRTSNLFIDTGTSAVYRGVVELQVREVGAERVLFGSDSVYTAHPPQVAKVAYARISDPEKEKVFGLNLAALLQQADINWSVPRAS